MADMIDTLREHLNAEVMESPNIPGSYQWRTSGRLDGYDWQPVTDEQIDSATTWAASRAAAYLGSLGGRSRSAAKIAAVRENGKRGGRPKSIG